MTRNGEEKKAISYDRVWKELKVNSRLMMVSRIAALGIALLIVPAIIKKVGLNGFGAWESVLALTTTITLAQGILKGALVWAMSNAYGASDGAKLASLTRLGFAITAVAFAFAFPIIILARGGILRFLNISPEHAPALMWILPVATGFAFLGGITDTLSALLTGHQRSGVSTLVYSFGSITQSCVSFGLLVGGAGIASLLIGYGCNVTVSLLAHVVLARKIRMGALVGAALPARGEIAALGRYSKFLSIGTVCTILRGQTDRVVLAAWGSSELVGNYGIAFRLAAVAQEVTNLFYTPSIAAAGALSASGTASDVERLYKAINRMLLLVVGTAGAVMIAAGSDVIRLWAGMELPTAYTMLVLLLCGSLTSVLLTGAATAVGKGVGKPELESKYLVVTAATNVLLLPALVSVLGPIGSIVASSAAWIVGSVYFLGLAKRALGFDKGAFQQAIGAVLLLFLCGFAGRAGAIQLPLSGGAESSVIRVVAAGAVGMLLFWGCASALRIFNLSQLRGIVSFSK